MEIPMMKCGHSANAIDANKKPCCVICSPDLSAYEIVEVDLKGRRAKCGSYGKPIGRRGSCDFLKEVRPKDNICHCEAESSTDLPFFEYLPNKEYDEFYCGCSCGWD